MKNCYCSYTEWRIVCYWPIHSKEFVFKLSIVHFLLVTRDARCHAVNHRALRTCTTVRVETIAWKHMCCLRLIWIQLNIKNYFEGPPLGYYHFIFMRYRTTLLPQLQWWHPNYSLVGVRKFRGRRTFTGAVNLMSQWDAAAAVETQRLADGKDQSFSNLQCVSGVRLTTRCNHVTNNTSEISVANIEVCVCLEYLRCQHTSYSILDPFLQGIVGCTACSLAPCHPVYTIYVLS